VFDWSVIFQNTDLILKGLWITIYYTILTTIIGLGIGLVIAIAQICGFKFFNWVGRLFVEFFRNVPLLVWLLWSYYALPIFFGINISKQLAGIMALSLYGAAYYAEILRAGILSLEKGQTDAARALGMSGGQAMRRIILPQAFRRMIPPLAGQTIIQMKNTTLLSVITVPDLLYQAGYISSFTYRPMEIYTAIGVVFLIVLIPSNYIARKLEGHN
jgi:polar amino acid transport system permease protein